MLRAPLAGLAAAAALAFPWSSAHAIPLGDPALYYRCHEQFVRRRPAPDDPLLAQVRAGKKRATDACLELLREVTLDGRAGVSSRSAEVLRTFQAFHMSWFSTKDLVRQETENPTSNLYDVNEMGYQLSYTLFDSRAKYADAVTRANSFRGIRVPAAAATHLLDPDGTGHIPELNERKWGVGEKKEITQPWSPRLATFGDLVGIAPMRESENPVRYVDRGGRQLEFDVSRGLGGGILGTVPYLLLTSSLPQYLMADGGMFSHRSWGRSIFEDLLCRSLPVVRQGDAEPFVQATGSHLPFRKAASCMQCHVSMDPLGEAARNLAEVRIGGVRDDIFSPRVLARYPVDRPDRDERTARPDSDPEFYRRPPRGRLYFRDFRGELVDHPITGLRQAGQAIAGTDDYYLCAAKRYFQFMTGIDVQLGDFSVAPLQEVDARTAAYRDFLIQAASHLRRDQRLQGLVAEILRSPYYRQSDYGGGGP